MAQMLSIPDSGDSQIMNSPWNNGRQISSLDDDLTVDTESEERSKIEICYDRINKLIGQKIIEDLLIPEKILSISNLGGVNLHPSLLPKYRGAFSCPWAIINGEKTTGITYHYMNKKFDDGNIILQKSVKITKEETAFSLYNTLLT